MRKSLAYLVMILAIVLTFTTTTFLAFAQEDQVVVEETVHKTEITTDDFLDQAAGKIKEVNAVMKEQGSTSLTVVLVAILAVAQMAIQFTKTRYFGSIFRQIGAKGKLAIVAAATVITTAVPLLLSGVGVAATLMSGAVLSAVMVAGHQIYLAFGKKDDRPVV